MRRENVSGIVSKYKTMEPEALIYLAQEDNKEALEELVRRNQKPVFNAFYHLDPKREDLSDLTQEALFKMIKSIKHLRDVKRFRFWLNQIILNIFYDELRKKNKKVTTVSFDNLITEKNDLNSDNFIDDEKNPHKKSLGNELWNILRSAINQLPEEFKLIVILRELDGLSYDEIAKATHTNIGTVKSRLARARGRLQTMIKPYLN